MANPLPSVELNMYYPASLTTDLVDTYGLHIITSVLICRLLVRKSIAIFFAFFSLMVLAEAAEAIKKNDNSNKIPFLIIQMIFMMVIRNKQEEWQTMPSLLP